MTDDQFTDLLKRLNEISNNLARIATALEVKNSSDKSAIVTAE